MSDERAALEARIEELQAENEFIREEWQQVQSATTTAAKGGESSDVEVLEQRLERSERAVVTKTRLCEMLTAELQKRQQQAPTPNQQCVSTVTLQNRAIAPCWNCPTTFGRKGFRFRFQLL